MSGVGNWVAWLNFSSVMTLVDMIGGGCGYNGSCIFGIDCVKDVGIVLSVSVVVDPAESSASVSVFFIIFLAAATEESDKEGESG